MKTSQLLILVAATTVLALVLAWVIERRQILSLREELEHWGTSQAPPATAE